ncbi:MAG: pyrroline-5-carboxylate reductase [Deltaproteobacteria bacterium]|nr:pyrroline-5-carboxylate reductase [Deltaproteobacteria bacterium]
MAPGVGFIGLGNMGGALVRGLAGDRTRSLAGFDPDKNLGEALSRECGLLSLGSAEAVCAESTYLILAVKPQIVRPVLESLAPRLTSEHYLVSIAAGVRIGSLSEWSGNICPVVRVMPNAPAMTGGGVFGLCFDHHLVSREVRDGVMGLFSAVGQTHVLTEAMLDVFTALVGSGPAFVLHCMEAMIDAGVTFGLPRAEATKMIVGLFSGTAGMAVQTGTHVTLLKEMVTSPGGTTIAGLNAMDRAGVKAGLHEAVRAALERCRELG